MILLMPVVVLALLLGACGDDDSTRPARTAPATSPAASPTVAGAATAQPSATVVSPSDPLDAAYVAGICQAELTYARTVSAIQAQNPDLSDKGRVMTLLVPALQRFVADLAATAAPPDIRDYHDQSVTAFRQAVRVAQERRDPAVLNTVDFGVAPPGLGARLQLAANKNKDCTEAGIRFDG